MVLRKKYGDLIGCLWQKTCEKNCARIRAADGNSKDVERISLEYDLFQRLLMKVEEVLEGSEGTLIESASEITMSVVIDGDRFDVSILRAEQSVAFKKNGEIMEKFSVSSCLIFQTAENNLPPEVDGGDRTIQ